MERPVTSASLTRAALLVALLLTSGCAPIRHALDLRWAGVRLRAGAMGRIR